MTIRYPDNNCVCETDEHWIGRNFLRQAFERAGTVRTKVRHGVKMVDGNQVPNMVEDHSATTPRYWLVESPATHRRQYFSTEAAEFAARPVRAFLEANGINVTDQGPQLQEAEFWKDDPDKVSVYSNGGWFDSCGGTNDPATVAMLPHMERKIWNLVRYGDEQYRF